LCQWGWIGSMQDARRKSKESSEYSRKGELKWIRRLPSRLEVQLPP
jgi:hypothetical protein